MNREALCPKCLIGGLVLGTAPDGRPSFTCSRCGRFLTSGTSGEPRLSAVRRTKGPAPGPILLCFGSRGWRNEEVIDGVVCEACPRAIVEGEARGADRISRKVGERRGIRVIPVPISRRLDGGDPMRRNARQLRDNKIDKGAGFITGPPGSPLTPGSRDMLERLLAAGVPTVVYRDYGVAEPQDVMRRLARRS